jgi:hypothetical protein
LVDDLNGAVAVAVQPGGILYASAMAWTLAFGLASSEASCARMSATARSSSFFRSDTRMPFSVSVPVLSAHTTSTRASPSIAGSSLTRHWRLPSRTTPTANAIEVISTRPSGTIGTSAPTIASTARRQPTSVVNSCV